MHLPRRGGGDGLPSLRPSKLPSVAERLVSRLAGVDSWRDVMDASKLSLCPRGFGRSSYHLAEAVQMGRVPIHVYADEPWVPYEALFRRELGYVETVGSLGWRLERLHGIGGGVAAQAANAELTRRERAAARLRESHFSLHGAVAQIGTFLRAPHAADLQCRRLPRTRCGGGCR